METDTEIAGSAVISCIKNARKFIEASKLLLDNSHYRESYLLTLYAGEEIGKVILVINYPCYTETEVRIDSWKKRFLDHTEKFWFLRNIDEIEQGYIPTGAHKDDSKQKNTRLEICYVDYRKGDFVTPREITQQEAMDLYEGIYDKLLKMEDSHPSIEDAVKSAEYLKSLPRNPEEIIKNLIEGGFKYKD